MPKEVNETPWQEELKSVVDTVKPVVQPRVTPQKSGLQPDTVVWTDVTASFPPIRDKKLPVKVSFSGEQEKKAEYNIKLLLPFNSNGTSTPEESRFVHFYAGVLLAIEDLDDKGIKLNIDVIDTEEGAWKITDRLDLILKGEIDMIIGPTDKDNLQVIVDTCRSLGLPVVSPYYTSSKMTFENPYYIQLKPNLKEHFRKLSDYCVNNYSQGEVAVLVRSNKQSTSWVDFFQEIAREQTRSKNNFYVPYIVSMESFNPENLAFDKLFADPKIKSVILPNYSFGDEDFVYSALRKLMAEKSREISVLGMPLLFDSDKVAFDFYYGLNMKIVMSDYVNTNHRAMKMFRLRYLDTYGHLPTIEAVRGYDLMLYLGNNIWQYGKNFQFFLSNESEELLQSIFKIEKAYSDDSPIKDDVEKFDYFENKHLDIIEFKGDNWFKVWK